MAKIKLVKPTEKSTDKSESAAPKAPKAPAVPVDQTKAGIRRAVALLQEAQAKLSADPAAVGVLINQAITELTT
jgi:hypothetical protein